MYIYLIRIIGWIYRNMGHKIETPKPCSTLSEQQRFWIVFAASSSTLPVTEKPKMEKDSKTIIAPNQPVTMGQFLQLFQKLNPNKLLTKPVANTQTRTYIRKIDKPELYQMV